MRAVSFGPITEHHVSASTCRERLHLTLLWLNTVPDFAQPRARKLPNLMSPRQGYNRDHANCRTDLRLEANAQSAHSATGINMVVSIHVLAATGSADGLQDDAAYKPFRTKLAESHTPSRAMRQCAYSPPGRSLSIDEDLTITHPRIFLVSMNEPRCSRLAS